MGRYLVTVGEFRQFVEATKYKTEAETSGEGLIYGQKIIGKRMPTGATLIFPKPIIIR